MRKTRLPLRYLSAIFLGLGLGVFLFPTYTSAHTFEPSLLVLRETSNGTVSIAWTIPLDKRSPEVENIRLELTPHCQIMKAPDQVLEPLAMIEYHHADCGVSGLSGNELILHGLPESRLAVVVRIETVAGGLEASVLKGGNNRLSLGPATNAEAGSPGLWWNVARYFELGFDHILLGFDHLAFVLCLVLILWGETRRMVSLVTGFTVGHSITLTVAALDIVTLPAPPVEALIALSIVIMAARIVRPAPTQGSGARTLWPVVFLFGLVHGVGFAGALGKIGLPKADLLWAIASFNIGVEAGQILFIALIITSAAWLRRLPHKLPDLRYAIAYGIGLLAAFWFNERVIGFFP